MKKCFECETTEDLQEHHVVPRSRGGTKTVTLCYECHMKAHGRNGNGINHSHLTKEGLARSKKPLGTRNPKVLEGVKKRGDKTMKRISSHILEAKSLGCKSRKEIADYLNSQNILSPTGKKWTRSTIYPILTKIKNTEISKEDK